MEPRMPESGFPKWPLMLAWLHVSIGVVVMVGGLADADHFLECYVVGLLIAVVGAAARRGYGWSRTALLGIHLLLWIALAAAWMVFFHENAQPARGPDGLGRVAVGVFGFQVFVASLVIVPLSGFIVWRLCKPDVHEHFSAARTPVRFSLAGGVIGLGLLALLAFGVKSQVDHSGEIVFVESLDLKWRVRPQKDATQRRRRPATRATSAPKHVPINAASSASEQPATDFDPKLSVTWPGKPEESRRRIDPGTDRETTVYCASFTQDQPLTRFGATVSEFTAEYLAGSDPKEWLPRHLGGGDVVELTRKQIESGPHKHLGFEITARDENLFIRRVNVLAGRRVYTADVSSIQQERLNAADVAEFFQSFAILE
jgi:hypothetical protein